MHALVNPRNALLLPIVGLILAGTLAAAPVLDSVTGTSPTAGGGSLTLDGSGFGISGAIVMVGGSAAPTISQSETEIVCTAPAGQGANLQVTVTVATETSNNKLFSYDAPAIVSIDPLTGPTSGGSTVTLTGTSFGISGANVTVGGIAAAVLSQTHTSLEFLLPAGEGSGLPVVVTVAGQSSPVAPFNYDAPAIALVSPANGPTQGGAPITLTGQNFGATGATVTIGGQAAPVTAQTHTEITCTLPPGEGVNRSVVVNLAGQSSAAALFSYNAPFIGSITPSRGLASQPTEVTLTGSNFGLNPAVYFGAAPASITFRNHQSITVQKPVTPGGDLPVSVVVAAQSSNSVSFRSVALTCLPGYYIDLDAEQVLPSPAGSYTAVENATSPTPAAAGFYCPIPGMRAAIPASPGYYVPTAGQSAQSPAELGRYASGSANTDSSPAEAGFYAPIIGCRAAIPAPEGTYVPTVGAAATLPVPAGYTTNGAGAATVIPLPQIRILSYELGTVGAHTIEFETAGGQSYGIYYSNNLIDYVLLEPVAGTGSPVTRTVSAPAGAQGRGFFIIAPAASP